MASLRSFIYAILLYSLCFSLISAETSVSQTEDAPSTITRSLPDLSTATATHSTKKKASTTDISAALKSSITSTIHTSTSRSTTSATSTAASTSGAVQTWDAFNSTETPEALPLQPRITPAFGIGGVLLILTGSVYAFIGIQHRLIYILLSTAYLVSLATTVLILYVMNPPISDAVQGAYLVAIALTGILIGVVSTIFPDLTEGFGCILGGFSFSMWLLVLKPGGLLTSSTEIVVFIVVFTVVIGATAYTPYTKPYTLIFSLAFGGATVVVLGIDCFTRAGLKEFWVYIWDINDNIFPLNTTTYPVTRGIKAEIAAIMIIAAIGILTQMKLWKFVEKRRRRRATDDAEHRRELDEEEEMVGQRVQWETTRAREQWEAVYEPGFSRDSDGKDSVADSGIGNMAEKKVPRITVQADGIEMEQLASPTSSGDGQSRAASLKEDENAGLGPSTATDNNTDTPREGRRKSRNPTALATLEGVAGPNSDPASPSIRNSRSKRISGSPDTPFPTLDSPSSPTKRASHRLSSTSILKRLSHHSTSSQRHGLSRPTSQQGLTEQGGDEGWDRASSVAATVDELDSEADFAELRSLPSGTPRTSMVLDKVVASSGGDGAGAGDAVSDDVGIAAEGPLVQAPPLTKDSLPPSPPKVTTSFRTQEWARHLPDLPLHDAVFPVIEDDPPTTTTPESPTALQPPQTPTTTTTAPLPPPITPLDPTEAPAPVIIAALAQTPATGGVAPSPVRPRSAHASMRPKSGTPSSRRGSAQLQGAVPALPRAYRSLANIAAGDGGDGIGPLPTLGAAAAKRETLRRSVSGGLVGAPAEDARRGGFVRQSSLPYIGDGGGRPGSGQFGAGPPQQGMPRSMTGHNLSILSRGEAKLEGSDVERMERRRSELWGEKVGREEERRRREGEVKGRRGLIAGVR